MNKKNYRETYAAVNGIEQYLLHYPKKEGMPVLLYLHGGPGFSESSFAYLLDKQWGKMFTLVFWDQRGAGRTLSKNKNKGYPLSINQMTEDLHGIIEHLKELYKVPKILILGHSWGSLLGSVYVHKHPENVVAYIGSGQVINMMDNEREGYKNTVETAYKSGDTKQIQKLEKLGEYPPKDFDELMKKLPQIRKIQESYEKDSGMGTLIKQAMKSPVFKWSDLISMAKAQKANKNLFKEMMDFDLKSFGSQYEVPVHYILGEDDSTTPLSLGKAYFETIIAPEKSIAVLPNAGHNPMYEQEEEFTKILYGIYNNL